MGDWVPHGLEAEDRSLPRPGCRLTALLCAPDSPADGGACPKSVFCLTLFVWNCLFPVDEKMITNISKAVIKPVV